MIKSLDLILLVLHRMQFNIENLIEHNSFFDDSFDTKTKAEHILAHHDEKFGTAPHCMYYFNQEELSISFLINEDNDQIHEQVEFNTVESSHCKFRQLNDFKKIFLHKINETYADETGETVVFINSGANVYFQDDVLSKITSQSQASRDLASKTMKRIHL